jgi:transcriptional regulator with XRE-family HTH domain
VTRKKLTNRWCFPAAALLESFGEGEWASNIGAVLGVSRTRVQQWRKGTTNLDPYTADKLAIKLGKHPSQIWTNWFDLPEFDTPQQETTNEQQ